MYNAKDFEYYNSYNYECPYACHVHADLNEIRLSLLNGKMLSCDTSVSVQKPLDA
jgi:hypothetical protein